MASQPNLIYGSVMVFSFGSEYRDFGIRKAYQVGQTIVFVVGSLVVALFLSMLAVQLASLSVGS